MPFDSWSFGFMGQYIHFWATPVWPSCETSCLHCWEDVRGKERRHGGWAPSLVVRSLILNHWCGGGARPHTTTSFFSQLSSDFSITFKYKGQSLNGGLFSRIANCNIVPRLESAGLVQVVSHRLTLRISCNTGVLAFIGTEDSIFRLCLQHIS